MPIFVDEHKGETHDCLSDYFDESKGRVKRGIYEMTMMDMLHKFVLPHTAASNSSLCELLQSQEDYRQYVGLAETIAIHTWKDTLFVTVIKALLEHFKDKPNIIVWFDLFSNNQHRATILRYEWWATTFKSAVKDIGHMVMLLTPSNNPISHTGAWCIYEAYCCVEAGSTFEVAMGEHDCKVFLDDNAVVPTQENGQHAGNGSSGKQSML